MTLETSERAEPLRELDLTLREDVMRHVDDLTTVGVDGPTVRAKLDQLGKELRKVETLDIGA